MTQLGRIVAGVIADDADILFGTAVYQLFSHGDISFRYILDLIIFEPEL